MRRAVLLLAVVVGSALCLLARDAHPAADQVINAVGLVDYSKPPDFRIGSWARYHVTAASTAGLSDDYVVTILIAGEQRFWGEDCFWVETWTEPRVGPPKAITPRMSYAVVQDSLPIARMQYYMRKSIAGVNERGESSEELIKRPGASLRVRATLGENVRYSSEKLMPDTADVPKGHYECERTLYRQGIGATQDLGDSTEYTENRENRTVYYSSRVPITHIVREDIERLFLRQTWQIGRSQEGTPLNLRERSSGVSRLIDYGEKLAPRLTPLKYQTPIRTAGAAASAPSHPAPKRR